VSKSHAKLAAALCEMGHQIAKSSIPKLLGYVLHPADQDPTQVVVS
jgi:hypothetical protein